MSFPRRSCTFPGYRSGNGTSTVSLLNLNFQRTIVQTNGGPILLGGANVTAEKITTKTRLYSLHFTLDSFTSYQQAIGGYLKNLCSSVEPKRPSRSQAYIVTSRRQVPVGAIFTTTAAITSPPDKVSVDLFHNYCVVPAPPCEREW